MTTILAIASLLAAAPAATSTHAKPRSNLGFHSSRFVVAGRLNRGLASTAMRGEGFALEAAGHRYRVHPALIAAIAGVESSYGAAPCSSNPRNVWGLGSCLASWVPRFGSAREAAAFFARWFRSRFAGARTPYDLHGYCVTSSGADCPGWADKVAWNMRALGFGEGLDYR